MPLLRELGTNAIRTYAVDPTADHDVCMALLEEAGIYVVSDLGEPRLSIETDDPQWNVGIFQRYKDVVDELGSYRNVIGFFAGNEVTTNRSNTPASAYVKAAVRDTKAYIKEQGLGLYVGYAANDDPDVRRDIAHYFNCGDQNEAIDFWGYNIYEWCGHSSLEKSGYDKQLDFFSNYSVPVFFAEYGCNEGPEGAEGRVWEETAAIYEEPMTNVFSGGVVYMYFQERNDYGGFYVLSGLLPFFWAASWVNRGGHGMLTGTGLVEIDGSKATRMKNFKALADRMSEIDPPLLEMSDYKPNNTPQSCPPLSDTWEVAAPALPPTPDKETCACMFASLSCVPVPGLDEAQYDDIFGYVCDEEGELCAGIEGDAEAGEYGAFAGCGGEEKLGFVLERYYRAQGAREGACDFRGQAVVVQPERSDECEERLSRVTDGVGGGEKDGAGALRVGVGMGVGVLGVVWGMLL